MTQEKQSAAGVVAGNRQQAPTLIGQIKDLLRTINVNELSLEEVEQPPMALWWDNKGTPRETMVLAVGVDDKGDLYLTLDNGCGGDVQIWESCGQLSDNDLESVHGRSKVNHESQKP